MTVVIIPGYGKDWYRIQEYVWFALEEANKARASAIVFTGGDTTDKSTGGPWEFRTEAEVMKALARIEIALMGKRMKIFLEKRAYNTLGNLENSKQMINESEDVIIVCNKAHPWKVKAAAVKVFGLKAVRKRISFRPFPLTTGKIENLKILIKTVPEVIGCFFRPLGRRIEYEQWKRRTGRNEQLTYKEFCSKFRTTGELI